MSQPQTGGTGMTDLHLTHAETLSTFFFCRHSCRWNRKLLYLILELWWNPWNPVHFIQEEGPAHQREGAVVA